MNARLLTVVLGLFFLLAFVACGDDGKVSEAPAPAAKKEGPAPATKKEAPAPAAKKEAPAPATKKEAPAPVAEKEAPAQVISIVDALGQNLEFSAVPERIVTISPTATEMLYLVGGEAVGRDRASNFPKEATSLPDVGSGYDPSIETLMSMRPDLVIVEALTQARFVPMLGQMGLTVMAVKVESVEDVIANIKMIGKVVGNEKQAEAAVSDIETRLQAAGTVEKTVLLLISDADRNLYAAKPESYTGLIASVLGLDNKAAGLPDSGPFPGFTMMSPAAILMANPDVLVTITPAPEPAPRLSESIKQIPPFAGLKAIQTNMVIEGDLTLFLQSPGPRIVEAIEFLKDSLD